MNPSFEPRITLPVLVAGFLSVWVFTLIAGYRGLVSGVIVLATALLVGPAMAYLTGNLLLLWLLVPPMNHDIILAEGGLATLVMAGIFDTAATPKIGVLTGLVFLGYSVVVFVTVQTVESTLASIVLLGGSIGIALYVLQRRELLGVRDAVNS